MTSLKSKLLYLGLRLSKRKQALADEAALLGSLALTRATESRMPPLDVEERHAISFISHPRLSDRGFFQVRPLGVLPEHVVIYLHGGAYVAEITPHHWQFISQLVDALGCMVIVPIFPLAPEHHHREIFQMVMACYDSEANRHHVRRVTVMGDSAGGGLALALTQAQCTPAGRHPDQLVLLSPWLDATMADPGLAELDARDPWLSAEGLKAAGRLYAGIDRPSLPSISPLFGPMDALPPTLVFTGTRDILHRDALRLRQRMRACGHEPDLQIYPDMVHVWMLLGLPESRRVIEQITRTLTPLAPMAAAA